MTTAPKVDQMIDARRHDSTTKRSRVLATVEKMLRDAKILQIYEGTNQIQRNEIAQALIKRAAKRG